MGIVFKLLNKGPIYPRGLLELGALLLGQCAQIKL
jgi:hypothetical protein